LNQKPLSIEQLQEAAAEVGLVVRASTTVRPLKSKTRTRLRKWLADGRAGEMDYLVANGPLLEDPAAWKDWARGIVLFALPYARDAGGFKGGGRVARFALGRDYHNVIGKRIERLGKRLRAAGHVAAFRGCTDAAPIAEREWAIESHVGWRGKNTLVLDPEYGPWVLLGELLVDCEVEEWTAPKRRWATCGSCTKCLDVCPTGALDAAWSMDARRCLSYLSIEQRGAIPIEWREAMGEWVFGCDLCLEVCPFGDHAGEHGDGWGSHPALDQFSLGDLLGLTPPEFAEAFQGSAMRRPGSDGMARNAAVVLGNLAATQQLPDSEFAALERALVEHSNPLVRSHVAWAIGRAKQPGPLRSALRSESEPAVLAELNLALDKL